MIFPGLIVPYCYRNIKKPSCSFFILANAILAHNSSANARWGKKEKKKKTLADCLEVSNPALIRSFSLP